MEAFEDVLPGNSARAFAIEIIQASIQLSLLSAGHGQVLIGQAIPELPEKPQALFWRKLADVDGGFTHSQIVS